jgi:putative hydrolase of the HAD superfamily
VSETLDRERVAALDGRGRGDKLALLGYLDQVFNWQASHEQRLRRFRNGIGGLLKLEVGVRELLVRLGARYRLGLVTNGTSATQRGKLASLEIEELFDPVIVSEEVGFRKPDARIFHAAIANWNLPIEEVLFIGDDPISDIEGARVAGMQAVRVGGDGDIASVLMLEAWLHAAE